MGARREDVRRANGIKIINKKNGKLKFIYRKNRFLIPEVLRMLFDELVHPHLDYESPAWYTNLTEKTKNKIQIMQNKCIRFCLSLGKMHHICEADFRSIN